MFRFGCCTQTQDKPTPPPSLPPFTSSFAAANSVSYVAPSLGAWLSYYTSTSAVAAAATTAAGVAGTTSAAAATGAGSVGAISAVSGAAGAGVAGFKMTRRTAGVSAIVITIIISCLRLFLSLSFLWFGYHFCLSVSALVCKYSRMAHVDWFLFECNQ